MLSLLFSEERKFLRALLSKSCSVVGFWFRVCECGLFSAPIVLSLFISSTLLHLGIFSGQLRDLWIAWIQSDCAFMISLDRPDKSDVLISLKHHEISTTRAELVVMVENFPAGRAPGKKIFDSLCIVEKCVKNSEDYLYKWCFILKSVIRISLLIFMKQFGSYLPHFFESLKSWNWRFKETWDLLLEFPESLATFNAIIQILYDCKKKIIPFPESSASGQTRPENTGGLSNPLFCVSVMC